MLLTLTLITVALVVARARGLSHRDRVGAPGHAARASPPSPTGSKRCGITRRRLPEKLTTINGALGALLGGLEAADRHVGRAASVFRLP